MTRKYTKRKHVTEEQTQANQPQVQPQVQPKVSTMSDGAKKICPKCGSHMAIAVGKVEITRVAIIDHAKGTLTDFSESEGVAVPSSLSLRCAGCNEPKDMHAAAYMFKVIAGRELTEEELSATTTHNKLPKVNIQDLRTVHVTAGPPINKERPMYLKELDATTPATIKL